LSRQGCIEEKGWKLADAVIDSGLTRWTAGQVEAIAGLEGQEIPRVTRADLKPAVPGLDLWDLWPVQLVDGKTALFDGWSLWIILAAPILPDPDLRHDIARLRLVSHKQGVWKDCGYLLPDDLNIGSREWAGTALYDPASTQLTLFYTASGYKGEDKRSFAQRLCQTRARLSVTDGLARTRDWMPVTESVVADGVDYVIVNQTEGAPGFIKGFRDPAHFRDPATGIDYLFFTGSLRPSTSDWNGVIGVARSTNGRHDAWELLPPVLSADGLNNELERPVMIARDGLYYLFWSTQRKVFAPDGPSGPNGLYGVVGTSPLGPFEPINGTGLVAANPDDAPFQTYSWWVTDELTVHGFVDLIEVASLDEVINDSAWRRAHFGGVPAPVFSIRLEGRRAVVEGLRP
jgi:levansucrase